MILPFSNFGLEHTRIVAAIEAVARETSAEIRVVVSRADVPEPMAEARRQFALLGLKQAPQRNGVLILLAPRSRTFAVIGDTAVHEKCGDLFWEDVAGAMVGFFQAGDFTGGLVGGIDRVGARLAEVFPVEAN